MTSPAVATAAAVTTKHPLYEDMAKRWRFCRDVKGGTEVFQKKKAAYLPRFAAEDAEDWEARVRMTFAYDALAQTVSAIVGLAFRQDPALGPDVPDQLAAWWENLDGEGTHGAVLAQRALEAALTDGHCGLLVDAPRVDGVLSRADEDRLGVRPYAVLFTQDQILNWRVEVVMGRRMLTMLVLQETVANPMGEFGVKPVVRYRVFRQEWGDVVRDPVSGSILLADRPEVHFQLYEATGARSSVLVGEGVLSGPTSIPFFPVYGGEEVDMLVSRPPLLGLAYSNVDHTQAKSDRRYSLHKCAVPVPVFVGRAVVPHSEGEPSVTMSSSHGIDVVAGGNAFYLEPQGAALGALRDELTDIEKRMAAQGLSILQRDTASAETATAFALQRSREESKLGRAVRSLQDAMEGVFGALAAFAGLPDGGSLILNRDFSRIGLSPTEIATLSSLVERGQLPLGRLLEALVKGGVLPEDMDVTQEVEAVRRDLALTEPLTLGGADSTAPATADTTAPAPTPDTATAQAAVLNGAQVTAAKDIVMSVAAGTLPRDSGVAMLATFFNLSLDDADRMMGSAGTGASTTPNKVPVPDAPADSVAA